MRSKPSLQRGFATALAIVAALLSITSAQPPGTALSPVIDLEIGERLPAEPLREHPEGLSLHTTLERDGRSHLRVRSFGAGLAVTGSRDIRPPKGARVIEWVSVADGREVIAVLADEADAGQPTQTPVRLIGYDTRTGLQTFACAGPPHIAPSRPTLATQSAVSPNGEHVAVALLFDAEARGGEQQGSTSVVLLALDEAGRLETHVFEEGLGAVPQDDRLARLHVDDEGAVSLAVASSDELHIMYGARGTDRPVHQRVGLPDRTRAFAYDWTAKPGSREVALVGLYASNQLWRHRVGSFAARFAADAAAADVTLGGESPAYPREWRHLARSGVALSEPAVLADGRVAFAAHRTKSVRAGHPKQAYRPRRQLLGDILVTMVTPEGRMERVETIERRLTTGSVAEEALGEVRLLPTADGVGVLYADDAASFFTDRGGAVVGGNAPDVTVWRSLGGTTQPERGRIVHDDGADFRGLPTTALGATGAGWAFVTEEVADESRRSRVRVAVARESVGL